MLYGLKDALSSGVLPQDTGGGKMFKKASIVWKLFIAVMAGISGVYLCFLGVYWTIDHSLVSADLTDRECSTTDRKQDGFAQHFPEPESYSREECACTPVHYFAILSMQRSGSGWFETLLNNHPNISSHGEVFSVKARRENFTTIVKTLDKVYNLDWASSASKNECTSAVGFKWMLNQGAMEYRREVSTYMQQRGVSVILLLRRNTLRRLISILANAYDREAKQVNGTHKSHVHSEEEANMLAEFRPMIDVDHLVDNLERVQQISDHAAYVFNNSRLLVVYYEDVVKKQKSLLEIENFLGVPARNLESRQVKIHRRPLSQQVQNWSEVAKRLYGTQYEKFLADDDRS
eukprot:TRINITY_DN13442_c0_g2_i1.p1 TRINITY_DN13442_c0_g2~~TRINITY_DN13442_c0_g2_i1.p1  ORF type:complete len:347 (+),score=42.07 TRINITY_DN13442_c0_g2_i1:77-1117(+)